MTERHRLAQETRGARAGARLRGRRRRLALNLNLNLNLFRFRFCCRRGDHDAPACMRRSDHDGELAYRALSLALLVRLHRRATARVPTLRQRAPRHLQAIGAVTVKVACGLDPALDRLRPTGRPAKTSGRVDSAAPHHPPCHEPAVRPRCERQSPGTATAGKRVGSPRIAAHWASSSIR